MLWAGMCMLVTCQSHVEVTWICVVFTVLSGAVSGGRCDLGRVSGGGDTDVSGVDTVVSGALSGCLCDLDSVSRGDLVVRVGEMSLSGCGDALVSGVDDYVCGVSSVMTAGDLDVCGCDSLVYGGDHGVGDPEWC